jgi:hypothetical protein
MSGQDNNSLFELCEMLKQKSPEYFNLVTSKSASEFESAFDVLLEKAVSGLEQNKKKFESLDEDGLSGALALALSMPGLTVTRETNSNGHVDLTIEADHCSPARRKLGEAKIYDGPAYHFMGLEQLLGRYTTGREERGLLIVYFRKPNISGLMKGLRERKPLHQSNCLADPTYQARKAANKLGSRQRRKARRQHKASLESVIFVRRKGGREVVVRIGTKATGTSAGDETVSDGD